jgi:hypothetical protein
LLPSLKLVLKKVNLADWGYWVTLKSFGGCFSNGGVADFPLLSEEGWLRDQENIAKHP